MKLLAGVAVLMALPALAYALSCAEVPSGDVCIEGAGFSSSAGGSNVPLGSGGGYSVRGPPTISKLLFAKLFGNSPPGREPGFADCAYGAAVQGGLDPVWVVAWAAKETSFGSAGSGSPNLQRNMFGMNWGTQSVPGMQIVKSGRYVKYVGQTPYCDSARDFVAYMNRYYVARGLTTPEQILPIYAPPSENDTNKYIQEIKSWVDNWRRQQAKYGYA